MRQPYDGVYEGVEFERVGVYTIDNIVSRDCACFLGCGEVESEQHSVHEVANGYFIAMAGWWID